MELHHQAARTGMVELELIIGRRLRAIPNESEATKRATQKVARWLEENFVAPASQEAAEVGLESKSNACSMDPESQAIALLFKQPTWSISAIADALNVDRKTPYKWERFRQAAELSGRLKARGAKSRLPRRGHKTTDGRVEAYDQTEDDE